MLLAPTAWNSAVAIRQPGPTFCSNRRRPARYSAAPALLGSDAQWVWSIPLRTPGPQCRRSGPVPEAQTGIVVPSGVRPICMDIRGRYLVVTIARPRLPTEAARFAGRRPHGGGHPRVTLIRWRTGNLFVRERLPAAGGGVPHLLTSTMARPRTACAVDLRVPLARGANEDAVRMSGRICKAHGVLSN